MLLEGLPGVVCQVDDMLIHSPDQSTHDARLHAVLRRMQIAGVTLNRKKCSFNQSELKFLGHVLSEQGVSVDPDKTSAIQKMKTPTNVSEMRRFLGMLGRFSPSIATTTQPLRQLLSKNREWMWGPSQEQAFARVKEELSNPVTLALYDPQLDLKISADASSFGLGAVIFQKGADKQWRPVAYASRALSTTETRYAQIEKEALASVWACEKFQDYILGRRIIIETDHKPLIPLLNAKELDNLPPRILRFRLRMTDSLTK